MNIALGKYSPYNTIIHRLDARVKLIGFILLIVSVFLNYGKTSEYGAFTNLVIYFGIFLLLIIIMIIGKVSFIRLFKSLKALWFMILLLLLLNIFFSTNKSGDYFTIGSWDYAFYYAAVINTAYIFLRLVLVLAMTNIFTSTTKPLEMTGALEWLLYPLKLIKIPVHKFAMAISLALRFIPTLIEEANRIMKAQASRGVDFTHGKFKDKIKAVIALIIPLFISAFTTSGELADAMEARGYDPDAKRTKYKTYKWSVKDTITCILLAGLLTGMILLASIYRFDIRDFLKDIMWLPRLK